MKNYISGLITASAALAVSVQAAVSNGVAAAATAVTNAATNVAVQTTASPVTTTRDGNAWLPYLIWGAVIAAIFFFLWTKGYLVKIRNYVEETKEELRKCSWPSREELKGSTVVVMVTIALLGVFTVGVDWILSNVIRLIT